MSTSTDSNGFVYEDDWPYNGATDNGADEAYLIIVRCRDRLKAHGDRSWKEVELALESVNFHSLDSHAAEDNRLLAKGVEVFTAMAMEDIQRV